MVALYHAVIYKPLLNFLFFLYQTIAFEDLGVAIIFFTLFIRLVLWPIFAKSTRHNLLMQRLQPEVKKIQVSLKNDRAKQGEAMMALYKKHRVNPFSGFFLLLIQLPILIALFQISLRIVRPEPLSDELYAPTGFDQTSRIHTSLFGLIDLTNPSILLVALAALAQYFQAKLSLPKTVAGRESSPAERVGRQMVYLAPLLTLIFLFRLPAALGLYWLTTSLVSIVQQLYVAREAALKPHGETTRLRKGNTRDDGI